MLPGVMRAFLLMALHGGICGEALSTFKAKIVDEVGVVTLHSTLSRRNGSRTPPLSG